MTQPLLTEPIQSFKGQFKMAKAIWNSKITRSIPSQVDKKLADKIINSRA